MISIVGFETEQSAGAVQDAHPAISTATRLQAVRRLDWRFLLPDPRLGRVACLAPVDPMLLTSLRLFSRSVEVVELKGDLPDEYDLVVSSNFNRQQLIAAVQLARPGGVIYGEAPGLTARLWSRIRGLDWRPGPSSYPAELVALASKLGLTNLQTSWHWPDFIETSQIVPLDNSPAMQMALSRLGRGKRGQMKLIGGSLLLKSGLLMRLIPCYSLVAQKPGSDRV